MAQVAAPVDEGSAQVAASAGAEASAEGSTPFVDGEAADEPASHAVRLSIAGGLGRVSEAEAADAANFAHVVFRVAYIGVQDLDLGLDTGLQVYERTYVTTLPGNPGAASLRVPVNETRMRTGLSVGFNILGPAGVDRDVAAIAPYLRLELDQFDNDVLPQTIFGVGLGLNTFVRIANGLHLEGGIAYSYAASAGSAEVVSRLAFGAVLGALRYRGGISIDLPPRAHLRVAYEGESLALEHANRFENSLSLGLDVDL